MPVDHSGGAFMAEDESGEDHPGYVAEDGGAIINDLVAEDLKVQAAKALADLPADLREVVQLYAIEEMTFDKIATILSTNKMDVYYKYHKGIEILRRQIAA